MCVWGKLFDFCENSITCLEMLFGDLDITDSEKIEYFSPQITPTSFLSYVWWAVLECNSWVGPVVLQLELFSGNKDGELHSWIYPSVYDIVGKKIVQTWKSVHTVCSEARSASGKGPSHMLACSFVPLLRMPMDIVSHVVPLQLLTFIFPPFN